MKYDLSKVHPELQPFARFIPKITFGENNLRLINLLMNLLPAQKHRATFMFRIPYQRRADLPQNSVANIQTQITIKTNACIDLVARWWIRYGQYAAG
jgi:hypothetical protein